MDGIVAVCHSVPAQWFGNSPAQYGDGAQCPPISKGWRNFNIGRAMFETDSLPPGWSDKCNQMDEVWVPSKFNVQTFVSAGVQRSKLFVVPEAIDTEGRFNPDNVIGGPYALPIPPLMDPSLSALSQLLQVFGHTKPTNSKRDSKKGVKWTGPPAAGKVFKFLSIFKWHRRKGVDVLLRAYCEEFTSEEPVVLYVKTNVYALNPVDDLSNMLEDITRDLNVRHDQLPRIKLIDEWIPDTRLPSLYAAADAFVLPSRGEGWGLPQAEAMAMGLPTIATDWSGTTEFLNKDVALPLKYTLKDLSPSDMEDMYSGAELEGHKYAEPSVPHLRELMRWIYSHPGDAKELGRKARAHMREHFGFKAVRDIMMNRLRQIAPFFDTVHSPSRTVSMKND